MYMRNDALCAAAEVVHNYPNALNVIPGEVELGVDVRGIL